MTIRMPQANIFDRFLTLLGKKRGVILPAGAVEKLGRHVYAKAWKENFWTALLRPANQPLPDGYLDLKQFEDLRHGISEEPKQ